MPDAGRYEHAPRPESVETFIEYIDKKKNVASIQAVAPQVIEIFRAEAPRHLRVFLTDVYIVGQADVEEIVANHPDVTSIVTMSAWNSYTAEAKAYARGSGVSLHTFSEFMKAVHLSGDAFLIYAK